jgi:hypothetical protein
LQPKTRVGSSGLCDRLYGDAGALIRQGGAW